MAFNSLYSDKDTPSRLFPHLIDTDTGKSDAINAAFVAELIGIDDIIRTVGYHEGSDLGGCTYRVVASATGTDDGGSYIDFTGFQLEAVFTSTIPAACFGATGDGTTDDGPALLAAITYINTVMPRRGVLWLDHGVYWSDTKLPLVSGTGIHGAGRWSAEIEWNGTGVCIEAADALSPDLRDFGISMETDSVTAVGIKLAGQVFQMACDRVRIDGDFSTPKAGQIGILVAADSDTNRVCYWNSFDRVDIRGVEFPVVFETVGTLDLPQANANMMSNMRIGDFGDGDGITLIRAGDNTFSNIQLDTFADGTGLVLEESHRNTFTGFKAEGGTGSKSWAFTDSDDNTLIGNDQCPVAPTDTGGVQNMFLANGRAFRTLEIASTGSGTGSLPTAAAEHEGQVRYLESGAVSGVGQFYGCVIDGAGYTWKAIS